MRGGERERERESKRERVGKREEGERKERKGRKGGRVRYDIYLKVSMCAYSSSILPLSTNLTGCVVVYYSVQLSMEPRIHIIPPIMAN